MKPHLRIVAATACLMFAGILFAQQPPTPNSTTAKPLASMPSEDEVVELGAKASEKVEAFQKTLDSVRPYLDKADPSAYAKDKNAIEGARTVLAALKKNGRSAYVMVSLLTTLDDLDLDATQDSAAILLSGTQDMANGKHPPDGMTTAVMMLTSVASSFYDISELVMHATLRLVNAEETVLAEVFADKK